MIYSFKITIEVEADSEERACKAARSIFLSSKGIGKLCGKWEEWRTVLEDRVETEKVTVNV